MLYSLLIALCWAVFLGYWLFSAFGVKKNKSGMRSLILSRVIIVLLLLALFHFGIFRWQGVGSIAYLPDPDPALATLGVIVCAAGIAFAIWARAHLGRNWGMPMSVKEDPELVTTGPYAYARHPIYTGLLFAILGSAAVVGPIFILVFVICAVFFIYAATREERLMVRQFPDVYPAYRQRTKMLIPFVF